VALLCWPARCWHVLKKHLYPKPGGDKIGRRRLDTHIIGFEKLGATFTYHEEDGFFHLDAKNLSGISLLLDETISNRHC
jgi:UDP-N-acetylglucosamine 1-carboxyvinyltransferase